jgi:imidazolonepropionase-like amidohydrolase
MLALVQLADSYGIALVLTGATQAWMIADELAAAKVTVIVQPSDNLPYGFDQIGARMDNAALLHAAGVALGIAVLGDAHNLRNVTQQAGLAVAYGLDREAALRAVTLNIARAYGMQDDYGTLAAGKVANVVVWNGDPFELSSFPTAVYVRGNKMPAVSRQTELRDRYLKR